MGSDRAGPSRLYTWAWETSFFPKNNGKSLMG